MYTDSFTIYIKTDHIYKDIAEDDEARFDTSNYELDRALHKIKNKKVIGLMKEDLTGKTMAKSLDSEKKTYSYLIEDGSNDEKSKSLRKCVMNRKL